MSQRRARRPSKPSRVIRKHRGVGSEPIDPTQPLTEPLDSDWSVTYTFGRASAGAWVVQGIAIAPARHAVSANGLLRSHLSRVPLAAIRRRLAAVIYRDDSQVTTVALTGAVGTGDVSTVTVRRRGRGRPAVLTTATYRKLRDRYMELLKAKDPHPAQTLADEENVSRVAMRKRLERMKRQMRLFDQTITAAAPTLTVTKDEIAAIRARIRSAHDSVHR